MKKLICIMGFIALTGCQTISSIGGNTNIPLATCSDAVAAIDLATAMKAAGKLKLAQEQTVETAIGKLQPVCGSATPQTILSAAETTALSSLTSITGNGSSN